MPQMPPPLDTRLVFGSPVRDLDAGGTMTLVRSLTGEAGILYVLNINGAHSLHSVAPTAS